MDGWGVIEVFDAFGVAKRTVCGLRRMLFAFSITLVFFEVFYSVSEVFIAF